MDIRAQVSMVFHLDKCIGCHTCSIACKNIWTDRKGTEYMWWNNVETKPGTGYPTTWENQDKYKGGWVKDGDRLRLRLQGRTEGLGNIFFNPELADDRRLLRTLDVSVRRAVQRARRRRPADRAAHLADHRQADGHRGRTELGRRLGRLPRLRQQRRQPGEAHRPRARTAQRSRAARLLLPAAHLQPLPQPELRGRVPVRRDLQARRRRHRPDQSGEVPRLAHVRFRLPLQEDVLQLVDRASRRSASCATRVWRRVRLRPASIPASGAFGTSAWSCTMRISSKKRRCTTTRIW